MTQRSAAIDRETAETNIHMKLALDGTGRAAIDTGIPFFDHMLTLFAKHGFFDVTIKAKGDIEVDYHHTVEDVGIVMGDAFKKALGDKQGIRRYGYAVTPMDEALTSVAVDISNRPVLVYNVPLKERRGILFDTLLSKEFFRALSNHLGMNLHINLKYGENEHHILESVFKAAARALDQATGKNDRILGVQSTKGTL